MCIRDRRDVVPESAGVIVRTAAEGASEEELRADVERLTAIWERIKAKAEAVSYTHLRAHETVLDLVCRLLLEKKKKHRDRSRRPVDYVTIQYKKSWYIPIN